MSLSSEKTTTTPSVSSVSPGACQDLLSTEVLGDCKRSHRSKSETSERYSNPDNSKALASRQGQENRSSDKTTKLIVEKTMKRCGGNGDKEFDLLQLERVLPFTNDNAAEDCNLATPCPLAGLQQQHRHCAHRTTISRSLPRMGSCSYQQFDESVPPTNHNATEIPPPLRGFCRRYTSHTTTMNTFPIDIPHQFLSGGARGHHYHHSMTSWWDATQNTTISVVDPAALREAVEHGDGFVTVTVTNEEEICTRMRRTSTRRDGSIATARSIRSATRSTALEELADQAAAIRPVSQTPHPAEPNVLHGEAHQSNPQQAHTPTQPLYHHHRLSSETRQHELVSRIHPHYCGAPLAHPCSTTKDFRSHVAKPSTMSVSTSDDEIDNNSNTGSINTTMNLPQPQVATSRRFVRWTAEEDALLNHAISEEGGPPHNWQNISKHHFHGTRNEAQCKGRWKKLCPGINRSEWDAMEDCLIVESQAKGLTWTTIAALLPKRRTPEQIRERFTHTLDPTLDHSPLTEAERRVIWDAQSRLGNRWTAIAQLLPGRSESMIKNCWHNAKTAEKRKLQQLLREQAASPRPEPPRAATKTAPTSTM